MDITGLVIFLCIGAVAGFLAGKFMRGGGFGIFGNIVIGIIGAVIGGNIFQFFGIALGGMVGSIVTATVGAMVLLFLIGLLKKI